MKGKLSVGIVLLALLVTSGAAWAAGTGVPLMVRSDATDDVSAGATLAARDAEASSLKPRLVASPDGRVTAAFDRGRYVFLSFSFKASSPFGIQVASDTPLGSVAVTANGFTLSPLSDARNTFATLDTLPNPVSVSIRLERGAAAQTAVTVRVVSVEAHRTLLPEPAGRVLDQPVSGLEFTLTQARGAASADILIPAIVRSAGLHGPVRSDVSIANRSAAVVNATLQFRGSDGWSSAQKELRLEPYSRVKIEDVVRVLSGAEVSAQGVVAIRGFVPASPGDVSAETYYENAGEGRVGTSLPLFFARPTRDAEGILATSTEGDPRIIIFSSATAGTSTARLLVQAGQGSPAATSLQVAAGAYTTARLSELVGNPAPDALVSLETDSADVHAVIVRSDPVSGSPFLIASN